MDFGAGSLHWKFCNTLGLYHALVHFQSVFFFYSIYKDYSCIKNIRNFGYTTTDKVLCYFPTYTIKRKAQHILTNTKFFLDSQFLLYIFLAVFQQRLLILYYLFFWWKTMRNIRMLQAFINSVHIHSVQLGVNFLHSTFFQKNAT